MSTKKVHKKKIITYINYYENVDYILSVTMFSK